ncbi:MAG: hypothetical protein O7I42_08985 [Alphaproteobacteria bacterium]|nr:hypothetical protein [Alphaproteobacteria bacterium]
MTTAVVVAVPPDLLGWRKCRRFATEAVDEHPIGYCSMPEAMLKAVMTPPSSV